VKILVYGSHKFDNYETFMRGIVVAIDNLITDTTRTIEILTAGPYKINSFTAEFSNKTQQYFKQKGIKIKFSKVVHRDVMENFEEYSIGHVLLFMNKTDIPMTLDSVIHKAESYNVNSSVYKY
jgi:NADH dehydrogenase FAD-containing subunit